MDISCVNYHAQKSKIRMLGLAMFVLRVFFIKMPFVNLEWVFLDAAQAIASSSLENNHAYFLYEANTLGMPIFYALVAKCLPFIPIVVIPRLVSALSFLVLAEALLRIYPQIRIYHSTLWLTFIIFFNPLIWIYAGRGTADLFPMSVAILAIALFLEDTPSFFSIQRVLAILLMNIAITLKYHAALLMPLCFLGFLSLGKKNFWEKKRLQCLALSAILITLVPLLYIFWLHDKFDFWVISSHFQGIYQPKIQHSIENFIIYGGYLFLLLLPLSLLQIAHYVYADKRRLKSMSLILVVFGVGLFMMRPDVEMNFGPLDSLLNVSFLGGLFSAFAIGLGLIFYQVFEDTETDASSKSYLLAIIGGIIAYLMLLSLTRPANRYLLFVLPFSYCLLWSKGQLWRYRKSLYVSIGLYFLTNVYLMDYQNTQGLAAMHMVNQLEKRHLISDTEPGSIDGHVGNYFHATKSLPKKLLIVSGASPDAVIVVKQQGIFSQKIYSLKRLDQHE